MRNHGGHLLSVPTVSVGAASFLQGHGNQMIRGEMLLLDQPFHNLLDGVQFEVKLFAKHNRVLPNVWYIGSCRVADLTPGLETLAFAKD